MDSESLRTWIVTSQVVTNVSGIDIAEVAVGAGGDKHGFAAICFDEFGSRTGIVLQGCAPWIDQRTAARPAPEAIGQRLHDRPGAVKVQEINSAVEGGIGFVGRWIGAGSPMIARESFIKVGQQADREFALGPVAV